MSKLKVGTKIFIQDTQQKALVSKLDSQGNPIEAITEDGVIELVNKTFIAWKAISFIVRFFINIFKKK